MTLDEFAVRFAVEYLDKQFATGKPADLVGMLNHVDYFERVEMVLEEVNQTLRRRPAIHVQRISDRIVFDQQSGDREITDEDLNRNVQMYKEWFDAQHNAMKDGTGYTPPEAFGRSR